MASSDKPTAFHLTLIFLVTLSLVLLVVTYLSYRDLAVAQSELATTKTELANANQAIERGLADLDAVKEALGTDVSEVGTPDTPGTVLGELNRLVRENGRDLQAPNYAATLTAMRTSIDQLNADLAAAQQALQAEQDQLLKLKAQQQEQIAQIQNSQAGSESTLQNTIADRDEIVRQKDQQITTLREDLQRMQRESATLKDQMERMRDDFNEQMAQLEDINTRLRTELDEIQRVSFEVPDGVIRRVDNTSRTVWINLGEEDNLRPQVTFSVYDEDHHGVGRGPEDIKGRVEVTRILGPHLSQARILEEDIFRPMTEGDVVHTPVWTAGLVEKFAFSGLIDFNQDGQSDRNQLHDMLQHAGAQISLEIDDDGNRIPENAELTSDTKFLVQGPIPDPAQYPADDPNRDRIQRLKEQEADLQERAQRQGIRILSLNDFLAFMGYKPTQRLFLPGANMPYTIEGGSRTQDRSGMLNPTYSSGQTSELFRRQEDRRGKALPKGTRTYGN